MTDRLNFPKVANSGVGQTPDSVSVADITTVIVPANLNRKILVLTNTGTNDVWLSFDAPALVSKGILIGKNGGNYLMDAANLSYGAANGITTSSTSSVVFQEFV